ncbi:MAG: PilZ domain-containing protein [Thermodesulfobacteriota bacterium]
MSKAFNSRRHRRTDSLNLSYFQVDENNEVIDQGMGRTLNISQSGILLETASELDKGQTLDMEMALHDQLISAIGVVIHVQSPNTDVHQVGVEFTTISDKDMETLKEFI